MKRIKPEKKEIGTARIRKKRIITDKKKKHEESAESRRRKNCNRGEVFFQKKSWRNCSKIRKDQNLRKQTQDWKKTEVERQENLHSHNKENQEKQHEQNKVLSKELPHKENHWEKEGRQCRKRR